jgi:hypothetical protein
MTCFQNIEKGLKLEATKMLNEKNEVTTIAASDELFGLWVEFIKAHNNGELIDLNTGKKLNDSKRFDYGPKFQLHSEFFKRLENLNKEEFKKLAIHLLNVTFNRIETRPKSVVHKFKDNLPQIYATKDWIEHKKRKKIVMTFEIFQDIWIRKTPQGTHTSFSSSSDLYYRLI